MKTKTLLTTLLIASTLFITNCKKKDSTSSGTPASPIIIPTQSTIQPSINMGAAASLAILAGTSVSSTGATVITGDLGLSPGSSVGGFPPGILNGTQHINDVTANQAKLDLTAAYNDAAGRTAGKKKPPKGGFLQTEEITSLRRLRLAWPLQRRR